MKQEWNKVSISQAKGFLGFKAENDVKEVFLSG